MLSVSVVIPVYNGEKYLETAVVSILEQTHSVFELVLVNDGSTDQSAAIIADFAQRDSRVVVLEMPSNQGLVAALNAGINHANGDVIARMDADDIAMPHRLEKQLELMENSGVCLLSSSYIKFREVDGHRKGSRISQLPHNSEDVARRLPYTSCICHPAAMFTKEAFDAVGGYDQAYWPGGAEDYDLWLRMSRVGAVANVLEPLLYYRLHDKSLTGLAKSNDRFAYNSACAVVDHFCQLYGLSGVSPKDGDAELVSAFSRVLSASNADWHDRCLIRWALRFARYYLRNADQKLILKACLRGKATKKEWAKWYAYHWI